MKARRVPLFMMCQRPDCGAVVEVRNPYEQRTRKYCSQRCVGVMRMRLQPIPKQCQRLGGLASSKKRRAAAVAQLDGMTPLQIFRLAFARGWHAGTRSARRRMAAA